MATADSADSIADALRAMSELAGEHDETPTLDAPADELPTQQGPQAILEDSEKLATIDAADGPADAAVPPPTSPGPDPLQLVRPVRSRRRDAQKELNTGKLVLAGLLGVLAGLLLIPAGWSAAVLVGLNVPRAEDPRARQMALVMLVAWPLAAMMLGAAAWIVRDVFRDNR